MYYLLGESLCRAVEVAEICESKIFFFAASDLKAQCVQFSLNYGWKFRNNAHVYVVFSAE